MCMCMLSSGSAAQLHKYNYFGDQSAAAAIQFVRVLKHY